MTSRAMPRVLIVWGRLVTPWELRPWGELPAVTEAVDRLLLDSPLRASRAERGRARAAEFGWDKAAERTLAVYRTAKRR